MAAKADDKVYDRQWCECLNKKVFSLSLNVASDCEVVGCSIGEERQRRRHRRRLFYVEFGVRSVSETTLTARSNHGGEGIYTGWPEKASHFSTVIKSHRKPIDEARFLTMKFSGSRSTRILSVDIKFSMCDLICDVISYCTVFNTASSADLAVPQTRLQTVGDRVFCVAAANTWKSSVRSDVISDTVDI